MFVDPGSFAYADGQNRLTALVRQLVHRIRLVHSVKPSSVFLEEVTPANFQMSDSCSNLAEQVNEQVKKNELR